MKPFNPLDGVLSLIASDPNIAPAFRAAVRPANFRAALDARPDVVERVLEDVQSSESEQSDWDEMNAPEIWDGGAL